MGNVRGKKSSDFEMLRGTHLGEDEDEEGGVVKRVLLGFLNEFEDGLVLRVCGDDDDGGGVEGEGEKGLDLFIVKSNLGSDCFKLPLNIGEIIMD